MVGSVFGNFVVLFKVEYCVVKFVICGLVDVICMELVLFGICVLFVFLSMMNSEFFLNMFVDLMKIDWLCYGVMLLE